MLSLLLIASAPALSDEARRVIEWQLRAPPRAPETAGLSPEEAANIRQRYLESIGARPPQGSDHDRTSTP